MRANLLDELRKPYVVTARSKGLTEGMVHYKHALKNALIPTVTVAAIQTGQLLGGNMIIETIFGWPGVGSLAMASIFARDYPVIQAIVIIVSSLIVLSNLVVDMIYALVDPRIRYR